MDFIDFVDFEVLIDFGILDFADLAASDFVDFANLFDFVDFIDFDGSETSDFAASNVGAEPLGRGLVVESPYFAASFKRLASRLSSFLDRLASRCTLFCRFHCSLSFFSFSRSFLIEGSMSKTAIFSRISFLRTKTPR